MDRDIEKLLKTIVGQLQFNIMRRKDKDELANRIKRFIEIDKLTDDAREYIKLAGETWRQ